MNLSKINPLGHLEQKHRTYRTIWISDIHLGSKGSQSEHLLEFLKYNDSEYLYLVGDIIDGWRLTKKWYWPQSHNDVIQKILRKARKGTKVFYIPGNHDEGSRSFIGLTFGDIKIRNQAFHLTAKEKKLWVVHGDMFDHVIQNARWLAYIGDSAYTFLLWINKWFNDLRRFFNLPYWSLSQYLKLKVKKAVSFINAFETLMVKEASKKALSISRRVPREYAKTFSWETTSKTFESYLVSIRDKDNTYNIEDNPHKGNTGVTRALHAAKNSWSGLIFAIREESAFRQEMILVIISLLIITFFESSSTEKIMMIFTTTLVLVIELLNSSIEAAIDRISFDYHGLSKRAKDYGSAAVMLSLFLWILIHGIVLIN